jgi:hypothetical protein
MSKSGISVLDARGDKIYVSVVKNNKIVVKPKIINVFELNNLIIKYKQLKIYKYFENSDVFKNLLFHLDDFCLVDDINKLQPLYIKVPI